MNNTFYKGYYEDHYLAHHGILGMHWGKRNGPPYPLTASGHSASEKKAGWRKSLGGGRNEDQYNRAKSELNTVKNTHAKKTASIDARRAAANARLDKKQKRIDDFYNQYESEMERKVNRRKAKVDYKERNRKIQEEYDRKEKDIESKYKRGQKLSDEDYEKEAKIDDEARKAWKESKEQYKKDIVDNPVFSFTPQQKKVIKAELALAGTALVVTGAVYASKHMNKKLTRQLVSRYASIGKAHAKESADASKYYKAAIELAEKYKLGKGGYGQDLGKADHFRQIAYNMSLLSNLQNEKANASFQKVNNPSLISKKEKFDLLREKVLNRSHPLTTEQLHSYGINTIDELYKGQLDDIVDIMMGNDVLGRKLKYTLSNGYRHS